LAIPENAPVPAVAALRAHYGLPASPLELVFKGHLRCALALPGGGLLVFPPFDAAAAAAAAGRGGTRPSALPTATTSVVKSGKSAAVRAAIYIVGSAVARAPAGEVLETLFRTLTAVVRLVVTSAAGDGHDFWANPASHMQTHSVKEVRAAMVRVGGAESEDDDDDGDGGGGKTRAPHMAGVTRSFPATSLRNLDSVLAELFEPVVVRSRDGVRAETVLNARRAIGKHGATPRPGTRCTSLCLHAWDDDLPLVDQVCKNRLYMAVTAPLARALAPQASGAPPALRANYAYYGLVEIPYHVCATLLAVAAAADDAPDGGRAARAAFEKKAASMIALDPAAAKRIVAAWTAKRGEYEEILLAAGAEALLDAHAERGVCRPDGLCVHAIQ
jgi:hypothetical protein